ncbi:hypothetical protein QR680_012739 [Steinernema hermaphroditum]|uniref:Uncharacterized protein n=1 Tax=Steinernema hermaphroditum TaxID=289476 RepID=A0AA39I4D1_9BILA|nr:hypothetical protein QR680_012739 [Steinernema hermaphroditum]
MSKKHLELYAPGESTQTRVTEELQSRREARDEDENALVLRLHRQDVAELKGVYEKVDKVIEELKSCRQLEVSFGDLTFLDGRQRVATTGFHNISLYKFKQMSSFEAFVSWYPSTRLEATVIMTDKSSRVRSVPFTKEESALLAELYSSNMEEYEGKFNSASAGSSGSKRIKNDFHEECKIFMDIFAFLEEKRDLPKTFRRITQTDYTEHIEWIEETFNNNSNVAFRADFDNAMGSCSTLAKLKVICIPEDFDTKHEMKVVKLIPSHISSRSSGVTFLEAVMIVREMLLSVIFPNSKPESRHTQMSKMGKFTTFHVMALLGFEHDYISKMGNAVRFLLLLSKADFEYLLKIFDSMIHTPLDLVGRVRFAVKGDAEVRDLFDLPKALSPIDYTHDRGPFYGQGDFAC